MSQPITSLRAGIIGTGFIGPAHIEALQRLGIPVRAIVDNDRAKVVADKWGIPNAITDLDHRKLVAHPEVDVVHIASPNKLHAQHASDALKAGKHVICEKPLAMTSKETAQLLKLAATRPRQIFAVNYNLRFYPAILQLRAAVQRGDLGDIFHVNGSYMQDWLLKDTDYNWRLLPNEGGALRAVSDIGTHWMDAASFVLGTRIEQVYAQLETLHKKRRRPIGEVQTYSKASANQKYETYPVQTEDYAAVLLRWTNGVFGSLNVSQVAAGRKNCLRLEIYGSKKSAWWNSEEPNTLHYGSRDGANETSLRGSPGFLEDIAGFSDYPGGHAEGFPDTFKMNCRAIYSAIAAGNRKGALFATVEDGHHEVKVCDAILKSGTTRRWVKV
ncbi:MAG: Gfo/Idh/MocA family oxidoreductase [Verrucomicrobiae bacterium]|nr:Gfo/Idh/MocA family oxidoreductase [Verrucomicrobiae bacterium]